MGVFGPNDDGGGGAVGHAGAVEHRELAGDGRHLADVLGRGLLAKLCQRVVGTVVMVLLGDLGGRQPKLGRVDAVLLGVRRQDHRVHGRGGQGAGRAVVGRKAGVGAGETGVLELVAADGHGDVIGAAGDRVRGLAQRLGPGGAVILDTSHRLSLQLEGRGEHDPRAPEIAMPIQ